MIYIEVVCSLPGVLVLHAITTAVQPIVQDVCAAMVIDAVVFFVPTAVRIILRNDLMCYI